MANASALQGTNVGGGRPHSPTLLNGTGQRSTGLETYHAQTGSLVTGLSSQATKAGQIPSHEPVNESPTIPTTTTASLTHPDDAPYCTRFSYYLLSQMHICYFTEADRLGKRKGLLAGFPGLACRHCYGSFGTGRFFPSSIKTLADTSKTLNVLFNHMERCRKCPLEVRSELAALHATHDDERAQMKFGSQKAFFTLVWQRLHGKATPDSITKRKADHKPPAQRASLESSSMPSPSQSTYDNSLKQTETKAELSCDDGPATKKQKVAV
jgi:hypothetical protein